MAWRIGENVVRGEIDNRNPGIITGTLYLEGMKEPIALRLEGNCYPDLAGRRLTFRNLMPVPGKDLDGFGRMQCGEAGEMTAARMSRIPTIPWEEVERCIKERISIPTRWSESLYLEWFSSNGRVLIEGSSFTCELSRARWRLSEEDYHWSLRLKQGQFCDRLEDDDETSVHEDPSDSPRFAIEMEAPQPHALVQRTSDFLLRLIYECRTQKFYVDDSIQDQPLEGMIEAVAEANTRLARAMARAEWRLGEAAKVILGLKLARWSLAQAADSADLARHLGSASSAWLESVRGECRALRHEIRCQILRYREDKQPEDSPREISPPESQTPEEKDTVGSGSEETATNDLP